MYAIIGITGHVGKVAANALLEKGLRVRGIVRSASKGAAWAAKGVDIAVADLYDAEGLEQAFKGCEGVFVMTPPLYDSNDPLGDHHRMLDALTKALVKAGPSKLVYLSSVGAHLEEDTGAIRKLYDMEQAFRALEIPGLSIRAAWFMENFAGSITGAAASGELASFLAPTHMQIPMVAVKDIGKLAASALQEEWEGHRIIELEGPCLYSADDVAMILGYQYGRTITARAIPQEQYGEVYQSFGFTPAGAAIMAELNVGFNSGWITFEGNGITHRTGATYLEDVFSEGK